MTTGLGLEEELELCRLRPSFSIELPLPPSINRYYGSGRGRKYLDKSVASYRDVVYEKCEGLRFGLRGKLLVYVDWYPNRLTGDWDQDNRLKGLLDAVEKAGVIENDSDVFRIFSTKWDPDPPGRCRVYIVECRK